MIHLSPNSSTVLKAKRMHEQKLIPLLKKRIESAETPCGKTFLNSVVETQLKQILIASPKELFDISRKFNVIINVDPDVKKDVKYVFNYESWFVSKTKDRYNAYNLALNLDIQTCVYCNRNYTNTVVNDENNEKIIRPEFDHFFDQNRHPILALSFYNLIPSCHTCNSNLKNQTSFNLNTHIHPFVDNTTDNIVFSYKYSETSINGVKISVKSTCDRTQKNLKEFEIEEIYNSHSDIAFDLLKIRQTYSDQYLEVLSKQFLKDIRLPKDELYRLVFGTDLFSRDFHKRPMSKFKHDILKELGIIP